MSFSKSQQLKEFINPLLSSMRDFSEQPVRIQIDKLLISECQIKMCFPFGEIKGIDGYFDTIYKPFLKAFPNLERRDLIVLAGETPEGSDWVACMGNYFGTFVAPFLEILPTGHLAHMRFHEFYRFEEGKVIEIQLIWDLPELMMQSNSWPMAPQLGKFICTPGPITGDGLTAEGDGNKSMLKIKNMLTDLCKHPSDPNPKIMCLEKHWHPRFNWYGPAGIGSSRGISGFRNWHQIPFLKAMPDRTVDDKSDLHSEWKADTHWIAEGLYVCETGWPNMQMRLNFDGWMGIAPVNKEIFLRSLDFWKLGGDGLIRENWVLVDILDMYDQIGIDVFQRLRELNKSRSPSAINIDENY